MAIKESIHYMTHYVGDPAAGVPLIVAGLIPNFLDLSNLQYVYFAVILPPAIFHFVMWIRNFINKPPKDWFDNLPPF